MFLKLWNLNINAIFENILHLVCESGNIDLVKYLISLNEIGLNSKNAVSMKIYKILNIY